jgi:hypothetical protein
MTKDILKQNEALHNKTKACFMGIGCIGIFDLLSIKYAVPYMKEDGELVRVIAVPNDTFSENLQYIMKLMKLDGIESVTLEMGILIGAGLVRLDCERGWLEFKTCYPEYVYDRKYEWGE